MRGSHLSHMNQPQKIEIKFEDKPTILFFLSSVAHLLIQSIIGKKKKKLN